MIVFKIVKVTGEEMLNLMSVVYVMEIIVHALVAWMKQRVIMILRQKLTILYYVIMI
jgi:hypothetical protein